MCNLQYKCLPTLLTFTPSIGDAIMPKQQLKQQDYEVQDFDTESEEGALDDVDFDDSVVQEVEEELNNVLKECLSISDKNNTLKRRIYDHGLLSREEEIDLCSKALAGCIKSRNIIIEKNQRLIYSVASKSFRPKNVEIEDMISYGNIGLIKAIEKFDPTKGYKFSTYAFWWIRQSINRHSGEDGRVVYVPDYIVVKANRLRKEQKEQENNKKLGNVIANSKKNTLKDDKFLSICSQSLSLDEELGNNGTNEDSKRNMHEFISDETVEKIDTSIQQEQSNKLLQDAFKKVLNQKELKIILLRYGLSDNNMTHTLEEISDHVGLTRERVRQIIVSANGKLKKYFESKGISINDFI